MPLDPASRRAEPDHVHPALGELLSSVRFIKIQAIIQVLVTVLLYAWKHLEESFGSRAVSVMNSDVLLNSHETRNAVHETRSAGAYTMLGCRQQEHNDEVCFTGSVNFTVLFMCWSETRLATLGLVVPGRLPSTPAQVGLMASAHLSTCE